MSKKKSNRAKVQQEKSLGNVRSRRHIFIIAAILVSLLVSSGVLAQWTGIFSAAQKNNHKSSSEIAPASLTSDPKEYIYFGSRLIATEEPTASGCASSLTPPGNLQATATSTISVFLSWGASTGGTVDHYEVERKSQIATEVFNVQGTSLSVTDNILSVNSAYVYRVRAFDSSSCPSPYSDKELATTTIFTENIVPGVTLIKANPLNELRTAVNAVRATAALGPFTWTNPAPAPGGNILKEHIQQLRNNLNEARGDLGLLPQLYTDEPLIAGTVVKAAHIQELRNGVQ